MRSATKNKRWKDEDYLAWLALQPCLASGSHKDITIHHVRIFGGPRDDRRGVPLIRSLHQLQWEIKGQPCVERGKKIFEKFWRVDLEAAIVKYNERYELERQNSEKL